MAETYCGKTCPDCPRKADGLCPGCKAGPGRQWSGDCEISVCCRDKRHESCETCTDNRYCGKYRRRGEMPERRDQKLAEQERQRAELARKAPFLGKWLWILFWLVVPSTVASILAMDVIREWAPGVALFGQILSVVCTLLYGLILLKLAAEYEGYRTAGILQLVLAGLSLLALISINSTALALIISLAAIGVGLPATYRLYMAHAAVLDGVDNGQAESWRQLWKWYIGMACGLVGSILLMLISLVLGMLVMVAASIGVAVVDIVALVRLYRMAQTFRGYAN